DRSTVSQVVQLLIRKGLLKRRRTRHDARAYAITLTEAGQNVLEASEPIVGRIEQALVDALPATRAKLFVSNLKAIVAAFEPAKTEPSPEEYRDDFGGGLLLRSALTGDGGPIECAAPQQEPDAMA